ncbi:heparinase II/III family protein [Amorphus suaedae]
MHGLLRYWNTVRHLRPFQIYGRAWHRLHVPKPDIRPAPPLRVPSAKWRAPAARPASMRGPDEVVFLNVAGQIAGAADWDQPERDRLWRYNLHYFDDLNADGADARAAWHRRLIDRWAAENPPALGSGWEPYPLSLRIVNWCKWALAGHELDAGARESLAVQARFLRGRLEWHLLGNHLFANAKALVFAGMLFEGGEADGWLAKGLEILAREVPEQVLPDGGHFELSPMYHALILEDLLDLLNIAAAFPGVVPEAAVATWREASGRMRTWLAAMSHPDGQIAFFNDAALGIAPPPAALEAYAERLGLPPSPAPSDGMTRLADSGYLRVAGPDYAAVLDVAPVGPDYLPGHAHADTLSFELSLHRRRVIVNSGTSLYGTGPERLRQRSTAAHSTVEVDGENSSEVWSGFRVARRARPIGLNVSGAAGAWSVTCAHTGYRRLPGGVTHLRDWRFGPRSLSVTDRLEGRYGDAISRFFLHPGVTAEADGRGGRFVLQDGQVVGWGVEGGSVALVEATWHPEFGLSQPTLCLEVRLVGPSCTLTLDW